MTDGTTSSSTHSVELQENPHNIEPNVNDPSNEASTTHSLPPVDGGKAAWRLLIAAFVFEALLWGFPLSFGVFQDYYSQQPQFHSNPYISVIGSTASGISYLSAPFIIPLNHRFPKYRHTLIYIGWPICILSLVAGSFARSLGALIFTQGIMYGVGFIIFYYHIIDMVNEYWVARRGMAYGLLCSASGVSGAVFPFCIRALLERFGYAVTLRTIAVGLFVLTAPLIPLLKGRLLESEIGGPRRTDWSFLRTKLFWVYSLSNLAMGLGYFFPSLYLPSYATANGLNSTQGALLLALMSVSQVLGQTSFGYLSDGKVSINVLAATSTLIASVAAYALWGLAHSLSLMIPFALVYGFFGGGYTAMWGRMGTTISQEPTAAFAAFGLLNFGKGIGNVLAGPLSGALLRHSINAGSYGVSRYEVVVLFTGLCMFLSAAVIALCYIKIENYEKLLRALANRT